MTRLLLVFPGMEALGAALAAELGARAAPVSLHRFPDGETLTTLPEDLRGRDVALLVGLRDPDPQALPLRFAAATARELGARSVGLIAPYLAYMRQDARFQPGQAVSAPIFARFLEQSVDWLVTLDPHLHRIARLDGLFSIPARKASAAGPIARWIAGNLPDAVLLGPDSDTYYGLEGTAAAVWEALETPRSLADLSSALAEEYDADAATIEADVTPFLTEMIASGFVVMSPNSAG